MFLEPRFSEQFLEPRFLEQFLEPMFLEQFLEPEFLELKNFIFRSRPPKAALASNTTYSESFLPVGNASRSMPIKPRQNSEWVRKSQFAGTSSYSEAFVPLQIEPVVPKVPSGNIGFSKDKMESETTNKLSYRNWEPLARESLPWKKKQPYRRPTQPLDDNSIYRSSYVAPEAYCYEECEGPSCPLSENFGMCLN